VRALFASRPAVRVLSAGAGPTDRDRNGDGKRGRFAFYGAVVAGAVGAAALGPSGKPSFSHLTFSGSPETRRPLLYLVFAREEETPSVEVVDVVEAGARKPGLKGRRPRRRGPFSCQS
jgi:hypothetical protein